MKVELRHLFSVCPSLDRGNVCPACPKVNLYIQVSIIFLSNMCLRPLHVYVYRKVGHWCSL